MPFPKTTTKCGYNSLVPIKWTMNSLYPHYVSFSWTNEFIQNLVKSLSVQGYI
jgi:hypothetical protein